MVTRTKTRLHEDMVARARDHQRGEFEAFYQALCEIEENHDGPLIAETLAISPSARYFFEKMGLKSNHEILVALKRMRRLRELRTEVGDPKVLADAQERLRIAVEAEQTTRAAAEDLGVVDARGVPALAKQIETLQSQLDRLTAEREAAEAEVRRIEQRRAELRSMTPAILQACVKQEQAGFDYSSGDLKRLRQVRVLIHDLSTLLCHWNSCAAVDEAMNAQGSQDKREPLYVVHSRVHLPHALDPSGEAVDLQTFGREIERIKTDELPCLLEEKAALEKELAAVKQVIEAPLEHWMQTGELSN